MINFIIIRSLFIINRIHIHIYTLKKIGRIKSLTLSLPSLCDDSIFVPYET